MSKSPFFQGGFKIENLFKAMVMDPYEVGKVQREDLNVIENKLGLNYFRVIKI